MTTPRYVFVGGLQRSGTTLLGRILAQHSQIAGLVNTGRPGGEGQFIQDVFPTDLGMGARPLRAGNTVRWAFHPQAHLTEEDLADYPDAGGRLIRSWEGFWDKPNAPVRVEKTPANVMKTRFLQAAIPGSSFIVITRNPIMQALAVRKWAPRTYRIGFGLNKILDHWFAAMETFRTDAPQVDRVLTVTYEELMRNPRTVIDRIQKFIGVPVEPLDLAAIGERSHRYRLYWARMSGDAPGAPFVSTIPLRSRLSPLWRQLERAVVDARGVGTARKLKAAYSARAAQFGYDLTDVDSFSMTDTTTGSINETAEH